MQFARRSLRVKMLAVMLLTTLAALIVALGTMIAFDLRAYRAEWTNDMASQAELLARTSAPALAFDDARSARENLGVLRYRPKINAAVIYNAHGVPFATYLAEGADKALPALPGADEVAAQGRQIWAFRRIVDHGQILGTVYLRADYDLYDRLRNYGGVVALVIAMAMLVAWGLSSWLRQVVTRPILEIGEAARDVVSRRDYSRRVRRQSQDELGALVDAFNEMMDEIERRTAALETSNREKAAEVEERRHAQDEVMRLNAELENRVAARTAELERSNRELALATTAAEEANRAKSTFLSNMSHELRTPLNAIIGFGQLLTTAEAQALNTERGREFVSHIVNAGRHLLTLISDILNVAQIEAGKLSLSLEPVALGDVLAECRSMSEPQATRRDVRLLFPDTVEDVVLADRTRLRQVLLNLLSNAIKYNRDHGSVVVDCTRTGPQRLRITIQDTGLGLHPEQIQQLFQPFNRLGQEHGSQEGTGIGLVLTKHLVELMGGTIGVESTPGAGSAFWVELQAQPVRPRVVADSAPAPAPAGDAVPPPAPDDRATTVLCVEDNPASLALISNALAARADIRLVAATNGKQGVDLARALRPDVILMDNNMPVLSGAEALALLKADARTAAIPVIAITANAMPAAIEKGLSAGFYRYLTKPVDLGELMQALDGAIELAARGGRAKNANGSR